MRKCVFAFTKAPEMLNLSRNWAVAVDTGHVVNVHLFRQCWARNATISLLICP